jgi:hypothetical protein
LSGCAKLDSLSCSYNSLVELDLSGCAKLDNLLCVNNQLSKLDVSRNTVLKGIYCQDNQLNELDISKNTALSLLYCNGNQLSTLDINQNTALRTLNCESNKLSSLDARKNTALTTLQCAGNPLTKLNFMRSANLHSISTHGNGCFDLSSGNILSTGTQSVTATPLSGEAFTNWTLSDSEVSDVRRINFSIGSSGLTVGTTSGYDLVANFTGAPVLPSSVTVSLQGLIMFSIGDTYQLTATVLPSDATQTVTWTSDNAEIATVSADGLITAVSPGMATITAETVNGKTATCRVIVQNVIPSFVAVTNITEVPMQATAGEDLPLMGTITPSNATNQEITWSVADAGTTGATISGGSNVLQTEAAGTATVRATVTNGKAVGTAYTQDFTVTVRASLGSSLAIGEEFEDESGELILTVTSINPREVSVRYNVCNGDRMETEISDLVEGSDGRTYAVTSIEEEGFRYGRALFFHEDLILPDSIVEIGREAFYRFRSEHKLVIPAGITTIGSGAFDSSDFGEIEFLLTDLSGVSGDAFEGLWDVPVRCPGGLEAMYEAYGFTNVTPITKE